MFEVPKDYKVRSYVEDDFEKLFELNQAVGFIQNHEQEIFKNSILVTQFIVVAVAPSGQILGNIFAIKRSSTGILLTNLIVQSEKFGTSILNQMVKVIYGLCERAGYSYAYAIPRNERIRSFHRYIGAVFRDDGVSLIPIQALRLFRKVKDSYHFPLKSQLNAGVIRVNGKKTFAILHVLTGKGMLFSRATNQLLEEEETLPSEDQANTDKIEVLFPGLIGIHRISGHLVMEDRRILTPISTHGGLEGFLVPFLDSISPDLISKLNDHVFRIVYFKGMPEEVDLLVEWVGNQILVYAESPKINRKIRLTVSSNDKKFLNENIKSDSKSCESSTFGNQYLQFYHSKNHKIFLEIEISTQRERHY